MSRRILVVEDDPKLLQGITALLKGFGDDVEIDGVASVDQALLLLKRSGGLSSGFDLVVSDIFVPGLNDGLDLWRFCRERWPDLPCVLMSGTPLYYLRGRSELCAREPIFISKPASADEFCEVVGPFLDPSLARRDSRD